MSSTVPSDCCGQIWAPDNGMVSHCVSMCGIGCVQGNHGDFVSIFNSGTTLRSWLGLHPMQTMLKMQCAAPSNSVGPDFKAAACADLGSRNNGTSSWQGGNNLRGTSAQNNEAQFVDAPTLWVQWLLVQIWPTWPKV
jgi:hypothetical protein